MKPEKFKKPLIRPRWNTLLDTFFDDERFFPEWSTIRNIPAANIEEKEKEFLVKLAVPGMTKEDFQIRFENGILIIYTEREEKKEEEKNYTRKEYSYNSFQRSFTLPENIKVDGIEAKYLNGELIIQIPKIQKETTKAQLIEVV